MTLKILPCVKKISAPFMVTIMAMVLLIMPAFVLDSKAEENENSIAKKLNVGLLEIKLISTSVSSSKFRILTEI